MVSKDGQFIWIGDPLRALEFERLQSNHVQFACFLDVLQIKYKKCARCEYKTDFFKPLSLKRIVEHKVEPMAFDKDNSFDNGDVILSKPFGGGVGVENANDHCWWIERTIFRERPDQFDAINDTQCVLRLRLFRLPQKFKLYAWIIVEGTVKGRIRKFCQQQHVEKGSWVNLKSEAVFNAFKNITVRIQVVNWSEYEQLLATTSQL